MSAKKQAGNGKIAAAYIRVSTEDQLEYSPDSQLKIIQEYAKKNGYILPPDFIFVDEGISGRSTKNRSAFMQVIALAKSADHPIDSILLLRGCRHGSPVQQEPVSAILLYQVPACSRW